MPSSLLNLPLGSTSDRTKAGGVHFLSKLFTIRCMTRYGLILTVPVETVPVIRSPSHVSEFDSQGGRKDPHMIEVSEISSGNHCVISRRQFAQTSIIRQRLQQSRNRLSLISTAYTPYERTVRCPLEPFET